ncbi:unnamed protein product [Caenorhabditis bovis]|uniref:EF-hand domain-containing protein n=1 Tax=Caenorhabditis bovis TaxID=2654633 RepID=A0A8S1EFJ2_9PELO|nr:unnamed protein product [Caenorhabditis bovis]
MIIRALVVICVIIGALAHQPQQFPGSNQPGQQQPPVPNQQGAQAQQFGGEQAKDEHHIKEHLDGKVDPTANMTPEQLQFHYFNMHDLDKNGKLDGVELIKAITHFHSENPGPQHQANGHQAPPLPTEVELETMIDSILRDDDFNSDGFIDYAEFLKAQKIREDQARSHQEHMAKAGTEGAIHQFADEKEVHNEEHIKMHLENKIEVEKLTEDQQRFHYFSLHDLNKDNLIDGIEILKALMHDHENDQGPGHPVSDEVETERLVDSVLDDLDKNGDGFIDYAEYNRNRKI